MKTLDQLAREAATARQHFQMMHAMNTFGLTPEDTVQRRVQYEQARLADEIARGALDAEIAKQVRAGVTAP